MGRLFRFEDTIESFDDTELRRMRAHFHDGLGSIEFEPTADKDIVDRFQTLRDEIFSLIDSCADDRDLDCHFWRKYHALAAEFFEFISDPVFETDDESNNTLLEVCTVQ